MKKTLLAAALLAGFATAGVAQAETSVTLYGILDTGYGYQNYKYDYKGANITAKSSGLRSGVVFGNRWGLRGSEDLGDGLRAIFTLENGFDIGNGETGGNKDMFNRQAFVGLSSDNWGTLTFGRQYNAGFDTNLAANGVALGDMDKIFGSTGAGNRVNNSFKYTSPNFSGFTFIALYGTGSDGGTWVVRNDGDSRGERGNRVSIGGKYVNGPLAIGASYDRQSVSNQSGWTDTNITIGGFRLPYQVYEQNGSADAMTNWQINASYDFEVVKVSLAYGQDRHGKIGWAGGPSQLASGAGLPNFNGNLSGDGYSFKSNNYHVGLSAPVGGGTLYGGWNYSTSNLDSSDALGDAAGNISTYHINYQYPLSKRTSVYAYGSYGKNLGYLRDLKGTELGLGMNHKF